MVRKSIAAYGRGGYKIEQNENQPHEAGLLKLDISKAIADIGWKPKMNASQTIGMTIDWYKAFEDKVDMNLFTEGQIKEFLV